MQLAAAGYLALFKYVHLIAVWLLAMHQVSEVDHDVATATETEILGTLQGRVGWKHWLADHAHRLDLVLDIAEIRLVVEGVQLRFF